MEKKREQCTTEIIQGPDGQTSSALLSSIANVRESTTGPGAFAVHGQSMDRRTTGAMSQAFSEEQTQYLETTAPPTVIAAEVASEDFEARIQRHVEARLQNQVRAEVQRALEQTAVPAANVAVMNGEGEVPEGIESNVDRPVNSDKKKWRLLAVIVCVFLVVVVAVGVGVTAAVLTRSDDLATNPPSDSPTDPPTDLPTNSPTPVTAILPTGPWQQLGQDVDGEYAGERSGWSVSLSKDASVMAIGAPGDGDSVSVPGYVRINRYNSATATWQQLGQELAGESDYDEFGISVSLNDVGDIVAIGATQYYSNGSGPGYVRVYHYDSSTSLWVQKGQELTGDGIDFYFGYSISLSGEGSFLAVGAIWNNDNGNNSGQARVFKYDTATSEWQQLGQDLIGNAAYDQFGWSISLNSEGNVLAVGANQYHNSGTGYVLVFQYNSTISEWVQLGQELDGEAHGDKFGTSVSVSATGDILAVGSFNSAASGKYAGRVYVYQYSSTTSSWNPLGQKLDGEEAYNDFGYSVSLSSSEANVLGVGAPWNDENGINSGQGSIYKYNAATSIWTQVADGIRGEAANDWSGWSVSLSGNGTLVAVGAPQSSDKTENAGHVRVYTLN